ncbi:MAG: FAD-binding oxidoreductase [Bacteroidia bacterium]|nr:FAD-binding oxidoreductase [Bacteroidia bacterium]
MKESINTDHLIIGQGLAGTLLAHFLLQQNQSVIILDEYRPYTSSRVAAGLFHPITGRRLVKSWMVETLFDFSREFYSTQEKLLHVNFFFPKNLIEIISSNHEYNVWMERLDDPGISQYLAEKPDPGIYQGILKNDIKMIALSGSGWMDISRYIDSSFKYFSSLKILESRKFDSAKMTVLGNGIQYENIHAKKIIFCEGSDSIQSPIWDWVPFLPSKGEILTIQSSELPENYILLNGIFIIPIGNQRFRVGSTYSWTYENELPTDQAKEDILLKLRQTISVPFEIVDHKSAIRPTVKDRRPILGEHPAMRNVYMFNGLGTKGVLLGPYFAKAFADHLINKTPLIEEVDLQRFYSFFEKKIETLKT